MSKENLMDTGSSETPSLPTHPSMANTRPGKRLIPVEGASNHRPGQALPEPAVMPTKGVTKDVVSK